MISLPPSSTPLPVGFKAANSDGQLDLVHRERWDERKTKSSRVAGL